MDSQNRKRNSRQNGRTITVADESKPIAGTANIAHPVQVGFTLGAIEPDIANLTVALEVMCRTSSLTSLPIEYSLGCI